ncbi:MAG: methylmalonyl-CoA mutase family protein, partial [Desulfotomaculales bacterium]
VVDPLGGSYFLEHLTDEMEKRIREMIEDIETRGDLASLADKGWFRSLFRQASERYARQVREGKTKVVGVNVYQLPPEEDTLLKEVAERKIEPCRERIAKVKAFKEGRDVEKVKRALQSLFRQASSPGLNLVPAVIEAMEADATMGEIAGTLRMAYGYPYDPHNLVEPLREGVDR